METRRENDHVDLTEEERLRLEEADTDSEENEFFERERQDSNEAITQAFERVQLEDEIQQSTAFRSTLDEHKYNFSLFELEKQDLLSNNRTKIFSLEQHTTANDHISGANPSVVSAPNPSSASTLTNNSPVQEPSQMQNKQTNQSQNPTQNNNSPLVHNAGQSAFGTDDQLQQEPEYRSPSDRVRKVAQSSNLNIKEGFLHKRGGLVKSWKVIPKLISMVLRKFGLGPLVCTKT